MARQGRPRAFGPCAVAFQFRLDEDDALRFDEFLSRRAAASGVEALPKSAVLRGIVMAAIELDEGELDREREAMRRIVRAAKPSG
jgi:hypothetical protein